MPSQNPSTQADMDLLETLRRGIATEDVLSSSILEASTMYTAGVLGLLKRDLEKAARVTGERSLLNTSVKTWRKQSDWRDYSGFECGSERVAQFVARWAGCYLYCKDGDGHAVKARIDGTTVVTHTYKVAD